jgi:cytoskeletal protein CcmA (bactofilin family)
MAVTRIKNNQITDSTVNAAAKLQNFSITSGKIANNLTYGSDLTIAGNLTVQGNVTAIDTTDLVVEDPLILLAKDQSGVPTLDIGFIGRRGNEENIAFIWDESADQFATVFTTSEITNTVVSISSYASLRTQDLTASNVSVTGNLTSNILTANSFVVSGNISANNLAIGNAITAKTIDTTGNVYIGGNLTVDGNITYININDLRIEDPIIIMGTGPNGAPLTQDDNLDRGIFMEYYTTGRGNAFVGWQNSSGNMIIASNVQNPFHTVNISSFKLK